MKIPATWVGSLPLSPKGYPYTMFYQPKDFNVPLSNQEPGPPNILAWGYQDCGGTGKHTARCQRLQIASGATVIGGVRGAAPRWIQSESRPLSATQELF